MRLTLVCYFPFDVVGWSVLLFWCVVVVCCYAPCCLQFVVYVYSLLVVVRWYCVLLVAHGLLFSVRSSLLVVCWLLFGVLMSVVDCCLTFGICCWLLFGVCLLLFAMSCSLYLFFGCWCFG